MADFEKSWQLTALHEGGFQDIPNDKGNWTGGEIGEGELKGTKWGISAAEFPNLDIKNLTIQQAGDIYREGYWKAGYSEIPQAVADKLFDLGVLFGVGTAVKCLQEVLKITPDGLFGDRTQSEINCQDEPSLLQAYKVQFVQHALDIGRDKPEERPFISSWIKRINS